MQTWCVVITSSTTGAAVEREKGFRWAAEDVTAEETLNISWSNVMTEADDWRRVLRKSKK